MDELVRRVLRSLPYCRDLPEPELEWLLEHARLRTLPAHTEMVVEGGASGALHVLITGRARIFKRSSDGRQQVLAVLQHGDSFNEVPVFDGRPDPANVETIDEATVLEIDGAAVRELLLRSPVFALAVLAAFAGRLRALTRLVQELAFSDVGARVARLVQQLANREGSPSAAGLVVPRTLTVQEMASMVGSVREVVSRALARFEAEGVLEMRRDSILIRDADALLRACSERD